KYNPPHVLTIVRRTNLPCRMDCLALCFWGFCTMLPEDVKPCTAAYNSPVSPNIDRVVRTINFGDKAKDPTCRACDLLQRAWPAQ
ncbi:hypothetical protein ACFL0Q_07395, partial [Thermodesulfobacteriota bacterium]